MFLPREQGIALLMVLVFMQISSLLGVSALTHALLEVKANHHQWQKQKVLSSAESFLSSIELNADKSTCQILMTPRESLFSKPLSFWQESPACHGVFHDFPYYYIVESLGRDDCSEMITTQSANYFRITLWMTSEDAVVNVLLQSTVAKSSGAIPQCDSSPRVVQEGRQSWQYLREKPNAVPASPHALSGDLPMNLDA